MQIEKVTTMIVTDNLGNDERIVHTPCLAGLYAMLTNIDAILHVPQSTKDLLIRTVQASSVMITKVEAQTFIEDALRNRKDLTKD